MKVHTPRLPVNYAEIERTLRSNYDFYTTFSRFMREFDMYSYYLPRLVQRSAKGRKAAIYELRARLATESARQHRKYTSKDISRYADFILKYISEAQGGKAVRLPSRVLHVSVDADPRIALHISDSKHFTSCLTTGIRDAIKHTQFKDVDDQQEYLAVVDRLSQTYLAQIKNREVLFRDMFHNSKGCNSMYLRAEVSAYEAGHIAYVVVGTPYHRDGVGYLARMRLHAVYQDNRSGKVAYWLCDSDYGDVEYRTDLLAAAKEFADEYCCKENSLLEESSRGKAQSVLYDGADLHYADNDTYKDVVHGSSPNEYDALYVVTQTSVSSVVAGLLISKAHYLKRCRKDNNMTVTYANHVETYTASFHAAYITDPSTTYSALSPSFRQTDKVPSGSLRLEALVAKPFCASYVPRYVRKTIIPVVSQFYGRPVKRTTPMDIVWSTGAEVLSPLSGHPVKLTLTGISFYVVTPEQSTLNAQSAAKFFTQMYSTFPSSDTPSDIVYVGFQFLDECTVNGKYSYSDYTLLYNIADVYQGIVKPVAAHVVRYESITNAHTPISTSQQYYTLEHIRRCIEEGRSSFHDSHTSTNLRHVSSVSDETESTCSPRW